MSTTSSAAKNTKLPCLLFDLDGTLVDTAAEFFTAVNLLRELCSLEQLPEAVIRSEVSNGARALTRLGTGLEESHPEFEGYLQQLLDHYINNIGTRARVFPGLDKLVNWCNDNNIRWGIVTNKPEQYATPLVNALQLEPACLVCPDHVKVSKPDPEGLLLAASQCNMPAENCYYFGDHARDIEAGLNAAMKTVACGWGYGSDYRQWPAHLVFETTEEALQHFTQ